MKPTTPIRPVVCFAALLWWAATILATVLWTPVHAQQALAATARTTPPPASNVSDPKPVELGVWHHFCDNECRASLQPRQSSTWRHFGDGPDSPSQPPGTPTWRYSGVNRLREVEQQLLVLVNRDRADPGNWSETHGRALPLQWNERLAAVARAHSFDMLNHNYFAHEDLEGMNIAQRVEAAGMSWQAVGENIAIYNSVTGAEAAFMNEPRFAKNHRANILNTSFAEVGIGIVQAPNGSLYITQDFYTRIEPPEPR